MFDDPAKGVYDSQATAFANQRPQAMTGQDLLDRLYGSGMGPANSNKATAELFSNGERNAMMPEAAMSVKNREDVLRRYGLLPEIY